MDDRPSVLVLACGALARELKAVIGLNGLTDVTVECLPGDLHLHPERIVPALEARLAHHLANGNHHDRILIGYGDCGTGGDLDRFCERHGVERLPGDHCYQFFAGHDEFLALHDEEPGTFYLTDYLAKHFDLFVTKALGLDRHPELTGMYFGNYRRLVHLAQVPDPDIEAKARQAAEALGLEFVHRVTGYGELESTVVRVAVGATNHRSEMA